MKESPDDKIKSTTKNLEKSLEPCNVCSESIEKAKGELYIDKNVTCYYEYEEINGFHVVKDICVDHGEIINELHDDMSKDTSPLEDKIKVKVFVQDNIALQINGENKLDSVEDSVTVLEPADNGVNEAGQQHSEAQNAGSEANGATVIYIPKEIKTKTEKNTISNPDIMKPTSVSGPDELELNTESESAPNPHDLAAVGRGGGESSFSIVSVTANGNISHRSDGSNSSVRSFAFPILPNEWNSSPIRMAKADPKQSQKHRGWRQAFICCGF